MKTSTKIMIAAGILLAIGAAWYFTRDNGTTTSTGTGDKKSGCSGCSGANGDSMQIVTDESVSQNAE